MTLLVIAFLLCSTFQFRQKSQSETNLCNAYLRFGSGPSSKLNAKHSSSARYSVHRSERKSAAAYTSWGVLRGRKIALLVDEIVGLAQCRHIIGLMCSAGAAIVVKRIYLPLNARKPETYLCELRSSGMDVKHIQTHVGGTKDPCDLELAMDAVEIAMGRNSVAAQQQVDTVAIASKDIDFASVHERIRGLGLHSYAIDGVWRTSDLALMVLGKACNGILLADTGVCQQKKDGAAQEHEFVLRRLIELNYLPPESSGVSRSSVALFIKQNNLVRLEVAHSPYVLVGEMLPDLAKVLSSPDSNLTPRSPGSLCVAGVGGQAYKGKRYTDYPKKFLYLQSSCDLVADLLRGLDFLDEQHNQDLDEAVEVFLQANATKSNRYLCSLANDLLQKVPKLHDRIWQIHHYVSRDCAPQVRMPVSSRQVEHELVARGFSTHAAGTPERQIMRSMRRYIRSKSKTPGKNLNTLLYQCASLLGMRGRGSRS